MKLNKKISKFLVLGMITNNLYFSSSANTLDNEIPGRYQTLEGEYITIDDSVEGNLEEIEIFGNTMQNEDDLNDIQSTGDLYVDEDGNPILDKQGRKQYKIDIISQKNIVKTFYNGTAKNIGSNIYKMAINPQAYSFVVFSPTDISIGDVINVEFEILSIDDEIKNTNIILNMANSAFTDRNIYANKELGKQKFQYTVNKLPNNAGIPSNSIRLVDLTFPIVQDIVGKEMTFKINIYKESASHKETILLPCQLQKVGNVTDRLYWDNTNGRYIIEKNIGKTLLDGGKSWRLVENSDTHQKFYTGRPVGSKYGSKNLNSRFKNIADYSYTSEFLSLVPNLDLCIEKSRLSDLTSNSLNEWLALNPITIYFENEHSELIETNITSKLKIPTYEGKTHLYIDSENGINPTLKVTIDRLPQIAKNSVEEAKINSNTSNISLARMYVNMLSESLYKDQLQEQLSEIFSSDIVLDRKTASGNLDVYIKSQNMLSMSLDTNSVTFKGYSGTEPMEKLNAVNLTINSSLPYDLNAYMPTEIINADGTNKLDLDVLNIRESNETSYQTFGNTTDKIVLKSNCVKGNNINHSIDLKLDSNAAHKADVYKTVIKFEAEQK